MENLYYLFGKAACGVFNETGSVEETKKELETNGGMLYFHEKDAHPTYLLMAFCGWEDFTQINEKIYNELNS